MNGGIFLIQGDDKLVEMKEQVYESEELLQKLLAKYPNLLAGDQMDSSDPRRWLLISREIPLSSMEEGAGRWSVDHLFLDQDAIPTLVEVKRSSDTRIRREVMGQMLDYAANAIIYWPIEKIKAEFETNCKNQGLNPEEVLAEFLGNKTEQGQFWQQAKTNLQAGKVRLVFVADLIPPELKRIVEFLNAQMDPAEVLAVEIKQYVGKGLKSLVPKIIGQTAEAQQKKRIVSQRTPDERATKFWLCYWEITTTYFPMLNMPEPGPKPAGSWFIYLYPSGLPAGVNLIHKLETGNVDLQFLGKGSELENFQNLLKPYLNEGMILTSTGKSAVVRKEVPRIYVRDDIDQQKDQIFQGLTAAKELLDWFNETNKKINLIKD